MKRYLIAFAMLGLMIMPVQAGAAEFIGKVETSGVIFKDHIDIYAFNDPTISGITCYVTTAVRSGLFAADPSDSSIACRKVGPIVGDFKGNMKNLFSQAKNAFFKTQTVDRFYDPERNAVVYISYTSKWSGDNHAHSISVVALSSGM